MASQRQALSQRLAADVTRAAARLAEASGSTALRAGVNAASKARLADELATAANVPLVVDAVVRSYRLESTRRTGWPVTRWLVRFRPDPLRRLNLRREGASPELNRTSLPPAGAPERARTDAAVREFADAACDGAPGPWRAAIRALPGRAGTQLPDALDQAIAWTDLAAERSWWWGAFNVVQWLALLTALGGFGWLGVLAGLGYLQLPVPEVPRVEGWPVPTLMIAGGALLGIVLALTAKFISRRGAPRAVAAARKRLNAAVAEVAGASWWNPWRRRSRRLESFNAALQGGSQPLSVQAGARRLQPAAAASRTLIMVRRFRVVVEALYFGLAESLLNGLSRVPPAGASQARASGPSRQLRTVQGSAAKQLSQHGRVRGQREVRVRGRVVGGVGARVHQRRHAAPR